MSSREKKISGKKINKKKKDHDGAKTHGMPRVSTRAAKRKASCTGALQIYRRCGSAVHASRLPPLTECFGFRRVCMEETCTATLCQAFLFYFLFFFFRSVQLAIQELVSFPSFLSTPFLYVGCSCFCGGCSRACPRCLPVPSFALPVCVPCLVSSYFGKTGCCESVCLFSRVCRSVSPDGRPFRRYSGRRSKRSCAISHSCACGPFFLSSFMSGPWYSPCPFPVFPAISSFPFLSFDPCFVVSCQVCL